jgi:glycogen debranching enzyme
MLMSKNWMHSVWSWDNCFNALALAYAYPDQAWAQIELMFEHQNEAGALPDALTDYCNVWAFQKPPVYGIIIKKLMEQKVVADRQLPDIYRHLSALTNFWFRYRDLNGNGVPEYFHGNDSGWDNATLFDMGFALESADLCTFLICQMDLLSEIAPKLNKNDEGREWKDQADRLLRYMLKELWIDEHFVARNINTGEWNEQSQSLLPYIPIILADRLPADYRNKLIADLKKSGNLNEYGLATENPNSPLYMPDGYWRGPIWAPTTWLIVRGLDRCGEKEFASEIARRFCDLGIRSGFPENYNALTGEPLRDRAYTWTSSVFLAMLFDYIKD